MRPFKYSRVKEIEKFNEYKKKNWLDGQSVSGGCLLLGLDHLLLDKLLQLLLLSLLLLLLLLDVLHQLLLSLLLGLLLLLSDLVDIYNVL